MEKYMHSELGIVVGVLLFTFAIYLIIFMDEYLKDDDDYKDDD